MYVRIVKVRGIRYMQVVHSHYVSGGCPSQQLVSSLGRYDEDRYREIQDILWDMQQLKRMQEVVKEIKNPPVLPGAGCCLRFSLRPSAKKD